MAEFELININNSSIQKNVIFSYKGVMDNMLLSGFVNQLTYFSNGNNDLTRKVSKVFIELAHNILYYSEERLYMDDNISKGIGTFEIIDKDNQLCFTAGNIVRSSDVNILQERCSLINSLTRDELRDLKRKKRKEVSRQKIGASIGLIQSVLISNNPLNSDFFKIDEEFSYFIIKTTFNK